MTCGKCGYKNPHNAKTCVECGRPLVKKKRVFPVSDIPAGHIGKLSNKKIIKVIYGRQYTITKTIFCVLTLLLVALLAYFVNALVHLPDETERQTPINFNENAGISSYVKASVTKIAVLINREDSASVTCAALTDDGTSCILEMNKELYLNDFSSLPNYLDKSSLPSEKGKEISGVCKITSDIQKQYLVTCGIISNIKEFNTIFGLYTIEVNDTPSSSLSIVQWQMFMCVLLPGFLLYAVKVNVFRKYKTLRMDLKRLRKTGDVDSVESLLEFAPYKPKEHKIVFIHGLFFSPYDGSLAKISDIVWVKHTPPAGIAPEFLHLYFKDGTNSKLVTIYRLKRNSDYSMITKHLVEKNPYIMTGSDFRTSAAYREVVRLDKLKKKRRKTLEDKVQSWRR